MFKRLFAAAALALSAAACSDATLPVGDTLLARPTGHATLAISNRGDQAVYFNVIDPSRLAIFIGCTPADCPSVRPGETVQVPYAEIINYEDGSTQALVDWVRFDEFSDGSFRQKDHGSLLVQL